MDVSFDAVTGSEFFLDTNSPHCKKSILISPKAISQRTTIGTIGEGALADRTNTLLEQRKSNSNTYAFTSSAKDLAKDSAKDRTSDYSAKESFKERASDYLAKERNSDYLSKERSHGFGSDTKERSYGFCTERISGYGYSNSYLRNSERSTSDRLNGADRIVFAADRIISAGSQQLSAADRIASIGSNHALNAADRMVSTGGSSFPSGNSTFYGSQTSIGTTVPGTTTLSSVGRHTIGVTTLRNTHKEENSPMLYTKGTIPESTPVSTQVCSSPWSDLATSAIGTVDSKSDLRKSEAATPGTTKNATTPVTKSKGDATKARLEWEIIAREIGWTSPRSTLRLEKKMEKLGEKLECVDRILKSEQWKSSTKNTDADSPNFMLNNDSPDLIMGSPNLANESFMVSPEVVRTKKTSTGMTIGRNNLSVLSPQDPMKLMNDVSITSRSSQVDGIKSKLLNVVSGMRGSVLPNASPMVSGGTIQPGIPSTSPSVASPTLPSVGNIRSPPGSAPIVSVSALSGSPILPTGTNTTSAPNLHDCSVVNHISEVMDEYMFDFEQPEYHQLDQLSRSCPHHGSAYKPSPYNTTNSGPKKSPTSELNPKKSPPTARKSSTSYGKKSSSSYEHSPYLSTSGGRAGVRKSSGKHSCGRNGGSVASSPEAERDSSPCGPLLTKENKARMQKDCKSKVAQDRKNLYGNPTISIKKSSDNYGTGVGGSPVVESTNNRIGHIREPSVSGILSKEDISKSLDFSSNADGLSVLNEEVWKALQSSRASGNLTGMVGKNQRRFSASPQFTESPDEVGKSMFGDNSGIAPRDESIGVQNKSIFGDNSDIAPRPDESSIQPGTENSSGINSISMSTMNRAMQFGSSNSDLLSAIDCTSKRNSMHSSMNTSNNYNNISNMNNSNHHNFRHPSLGNLLSGDTSYMQNHSSYLQSPAEERGEDESDSPVARPPTSVSGPTTTSGIHSNSVGGTSGVRSGGLTGTNTVPCPAPKIGYTRFDATGKLVDTSLKMDTSLRMDTSMKVESSAKMTSPALANNPVLLRHSYDHGSQQGTSSSTPMLNFNLDLSLIEDTPEEDPQVSIPERVIPEKKRSTVESGRNSNGGGQNNPVTGNSSSSTGNQNGSYAVPSPGTALKRADFSTSKQEFNSKPMSNQDYTSLAARVVASTTGNARNNSQNHRNSHGTPAGGQSGTLTASRNNSKNRRQVDQRQQTDQRQQQIAANRRCTPSPDCGGLTFPQRPNDSFRPAHPGCHPGDGFRSTGGIKGSPMNPSTRYSSTRVGSLKKAATTTKGHMKYGNTGRASLPSETSKLQPVFPLASRGSNNLRGSSSMLVESSTTAQLYGVSTSNANGTLTGGARTRPASGSRKGSEPNQKRAIPGGTNGGKASQSETVKASPMGSHYRTAAAQVAKSLNQANSALHDFRKNTGWDSDKRNRQKLLPMENSTKTPRKPEPSVFQISLADEGYTFHPNMRRASRGSRRKEGSSYPFS